MVYNQMVVTEKAMIRQFSDLPESAILAHLVRILSHPAALTTGGSRI